MKIAIIESPYAGDVERNLAYVRACMRDSLRRGEAPFASHALYTQPGVLDDAIPEERACGIEAGFAFGFFAGLVALYIDLGWSPGMTAAALRYGRPETQTPMFTRTLGAPWSDQAASDKSVVLA